MVVEFYFLLDLLLLDRPLLFQADKYILDHYETKFIRKFKFLKSRGEVVREGEVGGGRFDSSFAKIGGKINKWV